MKNLFQRAIEQVQLTGIIYTVHRHTGELRTMSSEEFERLDTVEVDNLRPFLALPPAQALSLAMRMQRN